MTRWPLRVRLVALLALALAPILALSAWRAHDRAIDAEAAHAGAASTAAELAVAPHREVIEGTRRLLLALREDEDVARWIAGVLPPDELARCETYLRRLVAQFPGQYSAVLLTDKEGVNRCSSSAAAAGASFADREIFTLTREYGDFVVASYIASRLSKQTILPAAVPVLRGGQFHGMAAIGISLDWFADLSRATSSSAPVFLTLVDRKGQPVAGPVEGALTLPVAARTARAVEQREKAFRDYGRDGLPYEYRLLPLGAGALLVVAAIPAPARFLGAADSWTDFGLVALTSLASLVALWFGAARWCLDPLKPIHAFAAAIAQGGVDPRPFDVRGPPEMRSLADNVAVMADAIRSRERDLRASLEQRDHMLREIHHRVKNNLQMISSLLSLQGEQIRSSRIRRHFADAQNRVLALSVLHRHLYERSSWALVDFQLFINDLVRQLSAGQEGAGAASVRFDIRAPVMAVGPDTAIPLGLIITEAVGNAFRHAFAGVEAPRIVIQGAESGGEVEFAIEDNGVGVDEASLETRARSGLGLTLIRGLATQLGGAAEVGPAVGGGTRVAVRFSLPSS
ncbi:MAG: sensor histidine kinase [Rhodospirillales bacterium]|nr:MAG: sensor histidine kinase [Rhodospirillales bacterium]